MEFNLPIQTVDSITWMILQSVGYIRNIKLEVVLYFHVTYGNITLRTIDTSTTEVMFFNPNYPELDAVLPFFEAAKLKTENDIYGKAYPEDVKNLLEKEYSRRIAYRQTLIDTYIKKLRFEEERLQRQSQAKPETSAPVPGQQPTEYSLTIEEKLSLLSDQEKKLLKLWEDKYSATEIGEIISLSPGRIHNMITDLRKRLGTDLVPYHKK